MASSRLAVRVLLIDNSAWARVSSPELDPARAEQVASWMEAGALTTCLPFLLEAGYSARSGADHAEVLQRLQRLPRVPVSEDVEAVALEVQAELARSGHHRLAPSDLIIAACAHHAGMGVLHYDRDYDVLASRTRLRFASEWLAPAGTLA